LNKQKRKKIVIWLSSVALVLALTVGGCGLYVSDYYRGDQAAIQAFSKGYSVTKTCLDDGTVVYGNGDETVGFLFYPGGKVEHTAYEPLMLELASKGVLCVLIEMPFRLAVLDVNAADGVQALYPQVSHWYIGGHSLGGSMAASYYAAHADRLDGLVLLGAYSTADLSKGGYEVLSIFGSEDRVMNAEKYESYKANLPDDFTEIVIAGGCHGYFGMYGEQAGDGTPTIDAEDQIRQTAAYIMDFIEKGEN